MATGEASLTRVEPDRTLADVYADRHERLDNFIFMYAIPSRLMARFGIEHSGPGYVVFLASFLTGILAPALVLTSLTGSSLGSELPHAVIVAGSLAALNLLALVLAQAAAYRISGLHRVLVDENQVRALMRWDRRWYSPGMSAVMGSLIALALLVVLCYATLAVTGIGLSPTTIWFCGVIAMFIGQFSFSTAMVAVEFRAFTSRRFRLFPLAPIATFELQETSAGLKLLGLVSATLFPLFLLVLLSVLPEGSDLNVPITAAFLVIVYLATGVGILIPLTFLGTIVRAEKQRLLEPIRTILAEMATRVQMLSDEEYGEYKRLQDLHTAIADSKETLLGFGAMARIASGLALSTLTVVATSFVQSLLQRAL